MRLSVVVVTYRRKELLGDCLASVRAALAAVDVETELVVIDNGSNDETPDIVRDIVSDAQLLVIPENIGFTRAVMQGIRVSTGDWIALLNDDVTVEPAAFRELLAAAMSADDIGAVAAQMRFADRPGVINSAGIEVDALGVATDRLLGSPVEASEEEPVEVFGVSGGTALYRRVMLDDLGGFDETFFAYLEDADVAWRGRMRGWRAMYAPAAVAYHHHSATLVHRSRLKYFLVGRNRVRLLAKNATRRHLIRYGVAMAGYDLGYVVFVGVRDRSLAPLRGRVRGLRDWREYRCRGAAARSHVLLSPRQGLRAALRRDRAWRAAPPA